jgi:chromosome segregation ATPase
LTSNLYSRRNTTAQRDTLRVNRDISTDYSQREIGSRRRIPCPLRISLSATMRRPSICSVWSVQRILLFGVLLSSPMDVSAADNKASLQDSTSSQPAEIQDLIRAATIPLVREIESLQERLEYFETKHETLEAATEQFRLKSKSMKQKLDEERIRYEAIASEKRSLEEDMEERIGRALKERTRHMEEYLVQQASVEDGLNTKIEHLSERLKESETTRTELQRELEKRLQKEKESFATFQEEKRHVEEQLHQKILNLSEQLSKSERAAETYEQSLKAATADEGLLGEKLEEERTRYRLLEESKASMEETLRGEIASLTERLDDSERQAASFEQSLKATLADEQEKDNLHQKELRKRIEEASRWEARIKELNIDNNTLHSRLRQKEDEAVEASHKFFNLEDQFVKVQGHLLEAQDKIQQNLESLERKAIENSRLQNELLLARSEIETAKLTEGRLTNERIEMERLYKDTLEQLEMATIVLNQTADVSKELQMAHTRYTDLNHEYGMIREELNATTASANLCTLAFGKLTDDFKENDRQLQVAQESLNETDVALKVCETEQRGIRRKMSQLLKDLEVARELVDKTESRCQLREAENRQLKARYTEMEMIALQHNRDLAESRSSISELVAKLDAAQGNISSLQTRTNTTETKLAVLQKDLEGCTGMYAELEMIARHLNESLSDSKNENAELSAALSDANVLLSESLSNEDVPKALWKQVQDFYRWLDYTLYQCLRWLLDLPLTVVRVVSQYQRQGELLSTTSPHDFVRSLSQSPYMDRFLTSLSNTSIYVSDICHNIRLFHGHLVGGLEWASSMLAASVQPSSEQATSAPPPSGPQRWVLALAGFLRTNGQVIVIFGEVVAALLCLDLAVSSLIRGRAGGAYGGGGGPSPSSARRKATGGAAKVVHVVPRAPPQADASLLRKAKLSNM